MKVAEIAVVCEPKSFAAREVLLGILGALRSRGSWRLSGSPTRIAPPSELGQFRGAGVVGYLSTATVSALPPRVPAVNLSDDGPDAPGTRVVSNHAAIGEAAAQHLLSTGAHHFHYLTDSDAWHAGERGQGFVERLSRAGFAGDTHFVAPARPDHRSLDPSSLTSALGTWCSQLAPHSGVFCDSDEIAAALCTALQIQERKVPDEIAVLGAGNDPLYCRYPQVSLSSIEIPYQQLGTTAVTTLLRIIRGEAVPRVQRIGPGPVLLRRSTTAFASTPEVLDAIAYIREHACSGIRIQDVLDRVRVSRRSLETHVRRAIGSSPYDEILRLRVERAQFLMRTTSLRLEDIAEKSGFTDARQMSLIFRKRLNLTPTDYRRALTEQKLLGDIEGAD